MRRESDINKAVIISIIVAAILVITLIGFLISKSSKRASEDRFASELSSYERTTSDSESASTQIGKSIEEAENNVEEIEEKFETAELMGNTVNNTTTTNTATNSNTTEQNKTTSNETKSTNAEAEKKEEVKFEAPVRGQIIREFAKDSLVYSNTLQEWITHTAIDIKADKTSVVKAAADGTVSAIKNDPRYGLTVIINHGEEYQTVYSNLLTAEFVVRGEKVEKGQTIGTVGNTASFEVSDEPHLHFELLRNNEYLDPVIYMSFE